MKASRLILAAAGLIFAAAGPQAFAATGAAAGLRPMHPAPSHVSILRGFAHRGTERGGRNFGLGHRNPLDLFGATGPGESETPALDVEMQEAAPPWPPLVLLPRVAPLSSGPRIIEVGKLAPAARRGPLPVVVYGDLSQ